MQKKFCSGSEVICFHVSVRLSLQKSAVTFDSLDGHAQDFHGPLNSAQVIFGRVTRTPGPSGSGQDPKKGFLSNLSPPGVLG